jgi:hypothetical protein
MISFSKLGKHGNLGNQLFEIASTIGIATKHNVPCIFPEWEYARFFKGPFPISYNKKIEFDYQVEEPGYTYHDLTIDTGKNVDLLGWFQSEKYWKHCEGNIKDLFKWQESFVKHINNTYEALFSKNTIAVSIRRGDYVGNENYHPLSLEYYKGAVVNIKSTFASVDFNVLVFSDDIKYCKENLPSDWYYMEGSAIEQLCLGSLCNHFVIANSSFSWWMAYLGEKTSSKIIAPEFWNAGPLLKKSDDRDVVPSRWQKLNPEFNWPRARNNEKINLSDVLFTIPVRYDHHDRKENLDLSIRFLQSYFNTNIHVSEMDDYSKFDYVKEKGVEYTFYKLTRSFERTRMLNDMARNSTCPIIVNWDCDVFMDPKQILDAVNKIRSGEASGIYPYDGRFFRCIRDKFYDQLRRTLSCEIFKGNSFPKHQWDVKSFGGAVIWNREDFIKGGMENEFMVHYGPEDFERYHRFNKLGFKIDRIEGPLFHIDHNIENNGSQGHDHRKENDQEFVKVKGMSPEDLRAYVSTWPWTKERSIKKIAIAGSPLSKLNLSKIYCLNLLRRTDRREYVEELLQELQIEDVEFFPAVDGKEKGLTHYDKRITPGMVGCYESHKRILEDAILHEYESILILEDDILPAPGILDLLPAAIECIPEDWEFAYLGCTEYGGIDSYLKKINEFWVIPRCAWGTQAYMIRGREPIRKIYEMINKPQERQIDEELANNVLPNSGLKYYSIIPSAFSQDFEGFESDVQIRKKSIL